MTLKILNTTILQTHLISTNRFGGPNISIFRVGHMTYFRSCSLYRSNDKTTRELEGKEIRTSIFHRNWFSGICARAVLYHSEFAAINALSVRVSMTLLFDHAWTLQEELLSKRILYLTSQELV
jgi:hypothetical protein